MNISKLFLLASIICFAFPALSYFVFGESPIGVAFINYIFDFLGSQLKLTVIAFVLFYAHKTLEKKMWS